MASKHYYLLLLTYYLHLVLVGRENFRKSSWQSVKKIPILGTLKVTHSQSRRLLWVLYLRGCEPWYYFAIGLVIPVFTY